MSDHIFMQRALELAKQGEGWVLPNPMVGAVVVKEGKIISEGFHRRYGDKHAEAEALDSINAQGCTLYVTLEPCDHWGKQGPCTEKILKSGVKKMVIASKDPSRNGLEVLKKAGLEVELGLLEKEARELNKAFFFFHEKKRPYVTLKVAMSKDLKISKDPKTQTWLSGKKSQFFAHQLRHQNQAILLGAGTILSDNPHLGVRHFQGKDPLRIILKGQRDLLKEAQVFRDSNHLVLSGMNVTEILEELWKRNIISVLIEGGQEVYQQFVDAQRVDELIILRTPQILGEDALPFLRDHGRLFLSFKSVRQLDQDFCINATPQWDSNNGALPYSEAFSRLEV